MGTQTAAQQAAAAEKAEKAKAEAARAERLAVREAHPDAWVAVDIGDQITGEVIDVQEAWSEQRGDGGSWYPLLTIRVEDADGYDPGTEVKVHAFSAVIYNEIMRRKPTAGERIRISYDGERPPRVRGHSPTKIHSVKVFGREHEGADVYARIGAEQPSSTVGRRRRDAETPPATAGAAAGAPAAGDDDVPF